MIADTPESPGFDFDTCLDGVRAGDQEAARALVARVEPMVRRIIRAHLPRRDAPEDIAQEVFMKMFARLDQYRGASSFRRWLSQVTLRTCFDHLRAQRCRPELRHADLSLEETNRLEGELTDENRGASAGNFASRELLQLLLAQLTPEDRRVVVLFNLEQKSIAEISELTHWSRDLVKMRVFRARRKLRRFLAQMPSWDAAPISGAVAPRARTRKPRCLRTASAKSPALPRFFERKAA
jgi:RNA polymerase sigma-70 factor (ECF subfamily)